MQSNEKYVELIDYSRETPSGDKLLEHISLAVNKESMTALIGLSGEGKTKLLDALAGTCSDNHKTSGFVRVNDATHMKDRDAVEWYLKVNYVPQEDLPYKTRTVRQILDFAAQCYNRKNPEAISGLVSRFKMEKTLDRQFTVLSGGEKKRVFLILGLLRRCPLNVLDEPLSGLDSEMAATFLELLKSMQVTSVVSIHQASPARMKYFDSVIFMEKGALFYAGSTEGVPAFLRKIGVAIPGDEFYCDYILKLLAGNCHTALDKANYARVKEHMGAQAAALGTLGKEYSRTASRHGDSGAISAASEPRDHVVDQAAMGARGGDVHAKNLTRFVHIRPQLKHVLLVMRNLLTDKSFAQYGPTVLLYLLTLGGMVICGTLSQKFVFNGMALQMDTPHGSTPATDAVASEGAKAMLRCLANGGLLSHLMNCALVWARGYSPTFLILIFAFCITKPIADFTEVQDVVYSEVKMCFYSQISFLVAFLLGNIAFFYLLVALSLIGAFWNPVGISFLTTPLLAVAAFVPVSCLVGASFPFLTTNKRTQMMGGIAFALLSFCLSEEAILWLALKFADLTGAKIPSAIVGALCVVTRVVNPMNMAFKAIGLLAAREMAPKRKEAVVEAYKMLRSQTSSHAHLASGLAPENAASVFADLKSTIEAKHKNLKGGMLIGSLEEGIPSVWSIMLCFFFMIVPSVLLFVAASARRFFKMQPKIRSV